MGTVSFLYAEVITPKMSAKSASLNPNSMPCNARMRKASKTSSDNCRPSDNEYVMIFRAVCVVRVEVR
jgi:hypothetical protein